MMTPCPHSGHFCPTIASPVCAPFPPCAPLCAAATVPGDFVAGSSVLVAGSSALGAAFALGAIFFFRSCSVSTVTLRLVLSASTSRTISFICPFSSSINCPASYFLCSISRSFFSQIPVSSQLFSSSSLIRSINSMPVGVAMRFLRSRLM